jgi:O-antigen ligase
MLIDPRQTLEACRMAAWSTTARFDRAFFATLADCLVVAVAFVLPWSTSAAGICIVVWLLVLLPTLDTDALKRELVTPAGGLPVLLWSLGALGMLWADVGWAARFAGLDGFNRLLMIPLLLAQFRRSAHGGLVVRGFLVSSALVLLASFVLVLTPGLTWRGNGVVGVPVHDNIFQDTIFMICGFGALGVAGDETRKRYWPAALALIAMGALFFANFAFVEISRISLAVAPVLAVLLGWRLSGWKGIVNAAVVATVIGGALWFASPPLRARLIYSVEELRDYRATDAPTDLGVHTAFLKESLAIIASAPLVGHGTGSIPEEFRQITAGGTGAAAVATVNPHNQTFAVAIQIGLLGALALWSMWVAHFLLFRGNSITAWLGTVVVTENIVSSTAHSHLFDFTHGWLYVFAVGVLGGMVLQERDALPAKSALPT